MVEPKGVALAQQVRDDMVAGVTVKKLHLYCYGKVSPLTMR